MSSTKQQQVSVLIIGATGRTGLNILYKLAAHPDKPEIHAFCRNQNKLPDDAARLCSSAIVEGDARSATDLELALNTTKANLVVMAVGNGDSVARTDIRTASAQALTAVLSRPQFSHVRLVCVSSHGAGSSRIKYGYGVGKLITLHIRHVLQDHNGQEASLQTLNERATIIRPAALVENHANGKVVEFGDKTKVPYLFIDRADLATYIVEEVCGGSFVGSSRHSGRVVNLTGVKQ